jgi:hypothetical protein
MKQFDKQQFIAEKKKEFKSRQNIFHDMYNGGWNESETNKAFHHGMQVGFDLAFRELDQALNEAITKAVESLRMEEIDSNWRNFDPTTGEAEWYNEAVKKLNKKIDKLTK